MHRPHISLNFAISLDGKIGLAGGGASKFTSQADLQRLLDLRKTADAILVGRGTLEADEMSLTIPPELKPAKQPLRCIVSRSGGFKPSHKVFHSKGGPVHLVITKELSAEKVEGASYHECYLEEFLCIAKSKLKVERLHCEGGGMLAKALFELDAVDEIHLTLAAHSLLGGKASPTLTGLGGSFLPTSLTFEIAYFEQSEDGEAFATWRRLRPKP